MMHEKWIYMENDTLKELNHVAQVKGHYKMIDSHMKDFKVELLFIHPHGQDYGFFEFF